MMCCGLYLVQNKTKNMKPTELELAPRQDLSVDKQPEITPTTMMQVIAQAAKDPNVDMDKMERLLAMHERMEAREAEKSFNAAFTKLQSELPIIVAESVIPNRGKYQRLEDIMEKDGVRKLLHNNGFSVSFTQEMKENRVFVTCHLAHIHGHSRDYVYGVRVSGKADTETQADCKASTTAKRNALVQALGLTIRQDVLNEENDAALEGDPIAFITPAQADELERRVSETLSDRAKFLKYAGATKFSEIRASKYDELDATLRRKEQEGR